MSELLRDLAALFFGPYLGSARGVTSLLFITMGGALVIAGSFVKTMVPLRALTIASNAALLIAAFLQPNVGALLLYAILLPVNAWRLIEIMRLSRQIHAATTDENFAGVWLKPYMKRHTYKAGHLLFKKGDAADKIYFLVLGAVELVEISKPIPIGQLFGEIAFFSPDRKRTLTARCAQKCVVLSISTGMFDQLYFQDPAFAFRITGLITQRLGADIKRLEGQIEQHQVVPSTGIEPVSGA